MSKYGGASAVFLVDGYNFLSAKFKTLSLKNTAMQEQTDGLGDPNEAYSPTGKSQVTLSQDGGFFDTAAAGLHAAMAAGVPTTPQDTARIVCVGAMGNAIGAVVYGLQGVFTTAYEALLTMGKLTKATVTDAIAGALERGQIIQHLATFTADWDTHTLATTVDYTTDASNVAVSITSNSKAAASVVTCPIAHGLTSNDIVLIAGVVGSSPDINGERVITRLTDYTFSVPVDTSGAGTGGTGGSFVRANSSNGGSGYQQITALSGFTGFVGKVRDSPDNTNFGDLITFDNVTSAPNAQRKTNVADTVVDRYLCYNGDVTGAGSITAFAMFHRG